MATINGRVTKVKIGCLDHGFHLVEGCDGCRSAFLMNESIVGVDHGDVFVTMWDEDRSEIAQ